MTLLNTEDIIPEIVKRTMHDGGTTIDPQSFAFVEPKDLWYYPKYPSLTQIVDVTELPVALGTFLKSNSNHLQEKNIVLGTWLHPHSGKVYIDINTYSKDENIALEDAKRISRYGGRQIVSMYNPLQNKTEYIVH